MAVVKVQCPECGSHEIVKYGRQANDEQRYRCNNLNCKRKIFLLQYYDKGRVLEVKQQIVEMALNGSGIRDIACVLGVSPTTVIATLTAMQPRSPARCARGCIAVAVTLPNPSSAVMSLSVTASEAHEG